MAIRKFTVDVTTVTATGTGYSPYLSGFIESVQYIKDGSAAYSDGVDATITADVTGEAIVTLTDMNASTIVKPRAATHTVAGAAATFDGTRPVLNRVALSRDRVKVAIAQGGNAKTGRFVITVDDGK
jgi:hypothetical protein